MKLIVVFIMSLALFASIDVYAGICRPQCTDYVNNQLNLNHHVGSAVNWWKNPPSGYKRHENGSKNKPSKKDIIVWANVGGGNGHVAVVKDRDDGIIKIKDSNWNSNWETDCRERTRELRYVKKNKKYFIQDKNVLGWLSRD